MASTSLLPTADSRLPTPLPQIGINVRLATLDDLAFIDGLQKKHSKQLGFFPRAQMEGYLKNGWVLIADRGGEPVGYCASRDRYLKRDELGAIFQLCVSPGKQRGLIGATLLKGVFERASYGTKLYCLWCAQDIAANKFWEAMGFVPLAFRAGSEKKRRTHLFWERRIRAGDCETPWWFPSQTAGGSIREDRIVLPIPPGTHWNDEMPRILPGADRQLPTADCGLPTDARRLPSPRARKECAKVAGSLQPGGLRFSVAKPDAPQVPKEKAKRAPRPKTRNDPKLIAAARELRDRWLEQVNSDPSLIEQQKNQRGKYDVSRLPVPVPMLATATAKARIPQYDQRLIAA